MSLDLSFVLLTYNQASFVQDAVESALNQVGEKIEILVFDDCSEDDTFDIVKSIIERYRGPHKVKIHRNETNLGLAQNFNQAVRAATGNIILAGAGDDINSPNRSTQTRAAFQRNPHLSCVSFRDQPIATDGSLLNRKKAFSFGRKKFVELGDFTKHRIRLSGASRAFRRMAFDLFGDITPQCPTEDNPMLLRCLILGPGEELAANGIFHRRHASSLSSSMNYFNLNFEMIRDQHLIDCETALEKQLISTNKFDSLCQWVDEDFQRRKIFQTAFTLEKREGFTFFKEKIYSSNLFRFREKLQLAKCLLKKKLV